jgi:aspartyl/asparaginyl-tRNA synthetase
VQSSPSGSGFALEPDAALPSVEVVRTVAHTRKALRGLFESEGYLEVVPPILESVQDIPFTEVFRVDLGDGRVVDRAQLSYGPSSALESLMPQLGNLYAIAPAFRGERGPDWLMEFHYVQAVGKGGLEQAFALAETIVTHVASELDQAGFRVAERAKRFDAVRVPYAEAIKAAGVQPNVGFDREAYSNLSSAHNHRPVFMTGIPLSLEPNAALGSRVLADGPAFFELVLPGVGEVASGKEYETSPDILIKSARDAQYAHAAAANWHKPMMLHTASCVQLMARLYSKLPAPSFSVSVGFERLTQYMLGAHRIYEAVAFPLTTDARTLRLAARGGA